MGARASVSPMKSTLLGVMVVAAATGLMFAASCPGRGGGPAACPGSRWCASASEAGLVAEPATGTTFTCPIGVPGITGKEPEVIAVGVAAQLLQSASQG